MVDPLDLDRFFNSASGYRAQYYEAEDVGDAANRWAVEAVLPKLIDQAICPQTGKPAKDLARRSLEAPAAKLWIYQGRWFRHCRRSERLLTVPRWQLALSSEDRRNRKLARWGSLVPASEFRVRVKGAFILDRCEVELGKAPQVRARELHDFGFT